MRIKTLYSWEEYGSWDNVEFEDNGTIHIGCNGGGMDMNQEETKELYLAMKEYYVSNK